jgi:hypothetical protein
LSLWLIDSLRRNHALEHATISILRHRTEPEARLSGRSSFGGFYIYGEVPTPLVEEAAVEALERLRRGEAYLAVTDLCGTNLALGGILAGLSGALAMGRHRTLQRLPQGILAALLAVLLAQPLGRWAQRHLTTAVDLEGLAIKGVTRRRMGALTTHKIATGRP